MCFETNCLTKHLSLLTVLIHFETIVYQPYKELLAVLFKRNSVYRRIIKYSIVLLLRTLDTKTTIF